MVPRVGNFPQIVIVLKLTIKVIEHGYSVQIADIPNIAEDNVSFVRFVHELLAVLYLSPRRSEMRMLGIGWGYASIAAARRPIMAADGRCDLSLGGNSGIAVGGIPRAAAAASICISS
jgi:hypothetical protein